MANIKSAIKRARQGEERRAHNTSQRSAIRSEIKKFNQSVESNDLESAKKWFVSAIKKIDRASRKGLIHPNKAAREKSRMAHKLNDVQKSA